MDLEVQPQGTELLEAFVTLAAMEGLLLPMHLDKLVLLKT